MVLDWGALLVDEPDGGTLLDWLKTYMGVTDTSQDDKLNRALLAAGQSIEVYLDRVIAKREVTEYFEHHFGTVELHEPLVDASAAVTVTLNGDVQSGYDLYVRRGQVAYLTRIDHNWDVPFDWRTFDQVEVTYTAGFDPLPVDIANAIVWTANLIQATEGQGIIPGGGGATGEVKSVTVYDVGSISYDVGGSSGSSGSGTFFAQGVIPDAAAQTVARYKRWAA